MRKITDLSVPCSSAYNIKIVRLMLFECLQTAKILRLMLFECLQTTTIFSAYPVRVDTNFRPLHRPARVVTKPKLSQNMGKFQIFGLTLFEWLQLALTLRLILLEWLQTAEILRLTLFEWLQFPDYSFGLPCSSDYKSRAFWARNSSGYRSVGTKC